MAHPEERLDAPDGSALTWIFDHILRYPGTYEIPLRTMYALNCNNMKQSQLPETAFARRPSSPKSSAAEDLRAQLSHQISRLPSQPCSLPPSFVTSFLRRCFTPQLEDVDFPQALAGLDYLRDFETRRKKEVASALQRLGLQPERPDSELARRYPGVMTWIESIKARGCKVEALYTQIYIGLRRWILLNEMLMDPFHKANCIAMLNTLFPPVTEATVTPTSHLTPQILKSQRDGFFRYITNIETNGKHILDKVIAQGAPEGESTGWPLVRDALDKYLRTANEIIDECSTIVNPASLDEGFDSTTRGHKGRKADSGISFGSILGESPSITTNNSFEDISERPLPPSPRGSNQKLGGSTLERLARELRKLGDGGKGKGLRKMKSTNTLGSRTDTMSPTNEGSFFELDDTKRKRLAWAHSKNPSGSSSRFD
ncbi:uncharacterized protein BDV17DRAFT_141703 [Aspergillus undulatus]|uniref:uncharacterized protein n=1 Tax=Aspergillus undulatus TaxID=1810928 RepID=UPI003CCCB6B1